MLFKLEKVNFLKIFCLTKSSDGKFSTLGKIFVTCVRQNFLSVFTSMNFTSWKVNEHFLSDKLSVEQTFLTKSIVSFVC